MEKVHGIGASTVLDHSPALYLKHVPSFVGFIIVVVSTIFSAAVYSHKHVQLTIIVLILPYHQMHL